MLTPAERTELKALQRRAYAADGEALGAVDVRRMQALLEQSRQPSGTARGEATRAPGADDTLRELGFGTTAAASDDRSLSDDGAAAASTDGPDASAHDGSIASDTKPLVRRRRPLLIGAAVLAAIALLAGGWVLGRSGGGASSDLTEPIASIERSRSWDAGSGRLLAYLDDTIYVGGTREGETCLVAYEMANATSRDEQCTTVRQGASIGFADTSLAFEDGRTTTWQLTSRWDGTGLSPAASDFTVGSGPGYTVTYGAFDRYGWAMDAVEAAVDWEESADFVGGFGPVGVWAGLTNDGLLCAVAAVSADQLSPSCADPTSASLDVTQLIADLTPDFASVRATVNLRDDGPELMVMSAY